MGERERRLARDRQRRLRARRAAELEERHEILRQHERDAFKMSRPRLYALVTSDDFANSWWQCFRESPPETVCENPDVAEYAVEVLEEAIHRSSPSTP
jgi:hypothetical protein